MGTSRKQLVFLGDTREIVHELPAPVRHRIGRFLAVIQMGNRLVGVKALKGFSVAVDEIRVSHDREAYRAVYTVHLGDRVYLLHVFHKKSKSGIGIPPRDLELIQRRLAKAIQMEDERNGCR
ncbi:MAG: type II toxin-antitoxin system RelE/ParE family toxin [Candidatus Hydrogenedentes bacterium]|nr:type II toxin-antitoxin system RelE/ParE family toxin [Candidatus Hydrogenedentota bacterium]